MPVLKPTSPQVAARLDRLPPSRYLRSIVARISVGGFFELYDLFMTGYIAVGLINAGIFTATTSNPFDVTGFASFVGAGFAGMFLGTLVFSWFSDHYGRRALFRFSLVWYSVATLIMAFMSSAVAIDLWGGVSRRFYEVVDREGRISLPEVGPLLVAGKSLADVQQSVQRTLRTQFRDISADVSLAKLRTIRVYIVGDVVRPGPYDISSLSTPLNALFAAGGPTTRGSLRIVKHFRGNRLVEDVDVYDLLLHGVKGDIQRLENGDTVLVPPLGPEITIEGMVRRPAIYEEKGEKSLADALDLAGGLLPSATLHHIEVQRLVAHQKQTMLSLDIPQNDSSGDATRKLESFQIQDGDKIRIFPIAAYSQDAVYLEGHVIRPGKYSYHAGMRLTDLINSYKDLLPEPASNYGEIIRLSAPDFRPTVQSFDLAKVLADPSAAPQLQPLDTVQIFGRYDFENPPVVSVLGDVRAPGTYRTSGDIHLSDAIHLAGGITPDAQITDARYRELLGEIEFHVHGVPLRVS